MSLYKWTHGMRGKLLLLGVVPMVFLICLSLYSIKTANGLQEKLNQAYTVRAQLITKVGQMNGDIQALGRWLWGAYVLMGEAEKRQLFINNAKEALTDFEKSMEAYLKLPRSEKAMAEFKNIESQWPKIKAGSLEVITNLEKNNTEAAEFPIWVPGDFLKGDRPKRLLAS